MKQDGATNVADIGTKVWATSRFTELRLELGRGRFTGDKELKESKAVAVGHISAGNGLEHKLGAMLTAILGHLGRGQDARDGCVACVVSSRGVFYRRGGSADPSGFAFMVLLVLLLLWAQRFYMGWKFK